MKAYEEVDVQIHILLTSALAGSEWSASCPCRFTYGEEAHGTLWIGGWVDPRAGLNGVEKITDPTGSRTATPRSFSPITTFTTELKTLNSENACYQSSRALYKKKHENIQNYNFTWSLI
jgi:hypothetical protein